MKPTNPFDSLRSRLGRNKADATARGPAGDHNPFADSLDAEQHLEYDPTQRQIIEPQLAALDLVLPEDPGSPEFEELVQKLKTLDKQLAVRVRSMVFDAKIAEDDKLMREAEKNAERANLVRDKADQYFMTTNQHGERVPNKTLITGIIGAVLVGSFFAVTQSGGEAATTTQPAEAGETIKNTDGSTTTRNADGSTTTTSPDGTQVTVKPNGDRIVKTRDGIITTTTEDGRKIVQDPSGRTTETTADGTVIVRDANGAVISSLPPSDVDSAAGADDEVQTDDLVQEATPLTQTPTEDSPTIQPNPDEAGVQDPAGVAYSESPSTSSSVAATTPVSGGETVSYADPATSSEPSGSYSAPAASTGSYSDSSTSAGSSEPYSTPVSASSVPSGSAGSVQISPASTRGPSTPPTYTAPAASTVRTAQTGDGAAAPTSAYVVPVSNSSRPAPTAQTPGTPNGAINVQVPQSRQGAAATQSQPTNYAYRRPAAAPTATIGAGGPGGSAGGSSANSGAGTQVAAVVYRRTATPTTLSRTAPAAQAQAAQAAGGANALPYGASDTTTVPQAQVRPVPRGVKLDANGKPCIDEASNLSTSVDYVAPGSIYDNGEPINFCAGSPSAAGSLASAKPSPYHMGQRMNATIETGILTTQGDKPAPVYARTQDGTIWLGTVTISATKRINIAFTKARLRDGTEIAVSGLAYNTDGSPGVKARYRDVAPTLANDLIRSSVTGIRNYVEAKIQATRTTTNANGSNTVERQAPTIWESVGGSAASIFQLPPTQNTFVTVAELTPGTPFVIVYGPMTLEENK
ncbi:hypothetical protein [Deinococcus ficus]|uniref:Uncharacterized protein n=1 Tax=Deinococcus ficus TaxID=317577 RepID=A0A221T330_9DEIO|nr:hypothetical protein [Deinococcus ficus]ASN83293.1 hypothetical protein DFI_19030 [Deinococcus ficus]